MGQIIIKTAEEIKKMREACKVTAQILDEVSEIIKPGISTEDINSFVHKRTSDLGATPAPLNYKGFPKSVCTSVNEVVCHGIPSSYVILKAGDIVNVDVTSIKDGWHGDASRMFFVGGKEACADELVELVKHTREALNVGIDAAKPGGHIGDIGAAIQKFIKKLERGYGIVKEYTGHGIGESFHESPQVIHVGKYGSGPKIEPGMTFTVEPMINMGTHKTTLSKVDGWTVRTADGKYSAQWEHTILITEDGNEKLTQSLDGQDY